MHSAPIPHPPFHGAFFRRDPLDAVFDPCSPGILALHSPSQPLPASPLCVPSLPNAWSFSCGHYFRHFRNAVHFPPSTPLRAVSASTLPSRAATLDTWRLWSPPTLEILLRLVHRLGWYDQQPVLRPCEPQAVFPVHVAFLAAFAPRMRCPWRACRTGFRAPRPPRWIPGAVRLPPRACLPPPISWSPTLPGPSSPVRVPCLCTL